MQLQKKKKKNTRGHTLAMHVTLSLAVDSNFGSTHPQQQHDSVPLWGSSGSFNGTGQLHLCKHLKAMGMFVSVK